MQTYYLIQWPESQRLMEQPWFSQCVFAMDIDGHEEVGDSAYFVPVELYDEMIFSDSMFQQNYE